MNRAYIFSIFFLFIFSGIAKAQFELPLQAKALFATSCVGCHSTSANHAAEAGLDLTDPRGAIDKSLVVPGSPDFSPLYAKVLTGKMPPKGDTFPDGKIPPTPTADQIAKLKEWIEEGAIDWTSLGPAPVVVPYEKVLATIEADVRTLSSDVVERSRYFSLVHLKNSGLSNTVIQEYQKGLVKLLNSLSLNPTIVFPTAIDKDNLIFRIDLKDFSWNTVTWNRYEKIYPFGVKPPSPTEQRILKKLGSNFAFLKADWFLGLGSRPQLYQDVLYADVMDIPGAQKATLQIETFLGIDRLQNILSGKIQRAGFANSGVSVNNRMIERHEIASYPGAYWLSYDFSGNSSSPQLRQNIFSFPLGPIQAFPTSDQTFLHAGGEVIFNLPNGLQAYVLVNKDDVRLDKAPTQIVTDPERPDRAVENAISCFRCHAQGMILKQDNLRDYILDNKPLFASNLNVLLEEYGDSQRFAQLQRKDLNRFLTAVKQIGIDLTQPEPVSASVKDFEQDLDLLRISGELYVDSELLKKKIKQSPNLQAILGAVTVPGGRVKREAVLAEFPFIIEALNENQIFGGTCHE